MKRYQLGLVAVALVMMVSVAFGQANKALDEKLVGNEKAAWEAFKAKDAKAFSALLTEDCQEVTPGGAMNAKAQILQDLADTTMTDLSLTDLKVVWIDKDAAIVTCRASVKGTSKGKALPEGAVASSSIWIKTGGKWLAKYHQETPVIPQQ